jgi:hypothetical protein
MILALAMPVVVGVGGFAVDYSSVSGSSSRLQAVVDSTALAIAREMTISPMTATRAQDMAVQYIAANIPANTPYQISPVATLEENNMAVRVVGTQQVYTPFGLLERVAGVTAVSATALARVTASSAPEKLCLLSLGATIGGGIYMQNGAWITAPGCMLQSNSTAKDAVILSAGSTIRMQTICARGGVNNMASKVEGTIVTDCPAMVDPLASKPEPALSNGCNYNKLTISAGSQTLNPGTYCGGLEITGTAKVTLNPGIYHFLNGYFFVTQTGEVRGNGVTLMFNGKKSYFRFEDNALIEISAPTSGATAGMLIWELKGYVPEAEDKPNKVGKAKKSDEHHINSDRARQLTGTIYLKQGHLMIDSTRPIADLSPYTIMVVNKLDLYDGPNLTLNSNYAGSTIPVPAGLGPIGATKLRLGM